MPSVGEHYELNIGFARLLQRSIMHPTLTRGDGAVVLAEKYDSRGPDAVKFVEWRLFHVTLRIFQRGFTKIIVIERGPEVSGRPIARPFHCTRPRSSCLVSGRSSSEGDRQKRTVRPPQQAELVWIHETAPDEVIDPFLDVHDLQVIVFPPGDGFDPLEAVIGTSMVVRRKNECPALVIKIVRVVPGFLPRVVVDEGGSAMDHYYEWVPLARD